MSWIMASWWRGERGKGWGQGERKSASGGGGGGQNEKPLHPSVFTSRPPSVAGLSLFPHYALLFSLFPFCVFFQRDGNPHISCSCKKTQCQCVCAHKESLHDIASLLAKWNFDDIQVLFGRKRDYAVFSDISRSHCSKSSRCTFNNCCKKKNLPLYLKCRGKRFFCVCVPHSTHTFILYIIWISRSNISPLSSRSDVAAPSVCGWNRKVELGENCLRRAR